MSFANRPGSTSLSASQRLDLIATSMIADSLRGVYHSKGKRGVLSRHQAQIRSQREIPTPDIENLVGFDPLTRANRSRFVREWERRVH